MKNKDKDKKQEYEITKEELAKATSIFVAGESHVMEKTTPKEAGKKGSYVEDIIKTGNKYINKEITKEEAEKEVIKKTTAYAISDVVDTVLDKAIDFVANIVKTKIPAIAQVIQKVKEPAKKFLKEKIINKVAEVAHKTWNKIKVSLGKLFG